MARYKRVIRVEVLAFLSLCLLLHSPSALSFSLTPQRNLQRRPFTFLRSQEGITKAKTPTKDKLAESNADTQVSVPVIKHAFELIRKNTVLVAYSAVLLLLIPLTDQFSLSAGILRLRRDMILGGIIFTIGDYGAQFLSMRMQQKKGNYFHLIDNQRLSISTFLGTTWAGIVVPKIYGSVENFLPGRSMGRVVAKMVITCSILSTMGNYANMFMRRWLKYMCEAWSGKTSDETTLSALKKCVKSCNDDFLDVLRDDLRIWPLYDIICYSSIPPMIRPITSATMSSLWSLYMSLVSASEINVKKSTSSES